MARRIRTETVMVKSSAQMRALAADLARRLMRDKRPRSRALVIGLIGELGSGKTTFVQGFIKALRARGRVTSPTFLIVRPHPLRSPSAPYRSVYHADLYRIRSGRELAAAGIAAAAADPRHVVLIEWVDRLPKLQRTCDAEVLFVHGRSPRHRQVRITVRNRYQRFFMA